MLHSSCYSLPAERIPLNFSRKITNLNVFFLVSDEENIKKSKENGSPHTMNTTPNLKPPWKRTPKAEKHKTKSALNVNVTLDRTNDATSPLKTHFHPEVVPAISSHRSRLCKCSLKYPYSYTIYHTRTMDFTYRSKRFYILKNTI